MRMRAKIARKMSFDPVRRKWIEIDPEGSGLAQCACSVDATEVDLSGSDLDNVSSVDRPLVAFEASKCRRSF